MTTPPTVRDVLAFPEVLRGHPVVVAGEAGTAAEVTWVHVLELGTVGGLLRGGETVLLTGVALPDDNDGLRRWFADLVAMRPSAVLIQLGERWTRLPTALVRSAERAGLPLVALRTAVPFVDITRAVLTSIVQSSYAEVEQSARIHEQFHRLAVEGRSDSEVVTAVSWLTGASVVFENRNHQVLAMHVQRGHDVDAVLRDWERRSRRDGAGEGWVVREVRARGRTWGRLIAQVGPGDRAGRPEELAVERGAENIALRRVVDGDGALCELETRSELLADLLRGRYVSEAEARMRAEAAGVPMAGRLLVGVAVRSAAGTPALSGAPSVQVGVARSATAVRLPLLMGTDGTGMVSVPPDGELSDVLRAWSERLRREVPDAVIGVGGPGTVLAGVRESLLDAGAAAAAEVARAAAARGPARPVVGLGDLGVRGLLAQLADDPRLQSFVERELGPLLDPERATELAAVAAYLGEGRNKSAAAHRLRISRPAFYARLQRAAGLLGADLDDAETCLSLQLALLGRETGGAVRG